MNFKNTNELNEYVKNTMATTTYNMNVVLEDKYYVVTQNDINHLMESLLEEGSNLQYLGFTTTILDGVDVNQYTFKALDDNNNGNITLYVEK